MTKTSEKTLLWVDEPKVKEAERQVKEAVKTLNEGSKMAEKFLNTQFTKEQKHRFMAEGWAFVYELLKAKFIIPKATDELNYQALGIDPKPLQDYIARHTPNWIRCNYDLTGEGVFVAGDHQPLIKKHHYYADTDKKRQALRLAEKMSQDLIQWKIAGLIDHSDLIPALREMTNGILKAGEGKDYKRILINKEKIAKLR